MDVGQCAGRKTAAGSGSTSFVDVLAWKQRSKTILHYIDISTLNHDNMICMKKANSIPHSIFFKFCH